MSTVVSVLLGCAGMGAFYVALAWLLKRQETGFANQADAWFAELRGRGWRVTPGESTQEFTLEHVLHGVPVVYAQRYVRTGSGDDEKWTIGVSASATIAAPIGDLRVQTEGVLARVGKMLGGQDIELGDSEFDPAFRVECTDPGVARRMLSSSARRAILDAHAKLGDALGVRDGKVVWDGWSGVQGMTIDEIADLLAITSTRFGS